MGKLLVQIPRKEQKDIHKRIMNRGIFEQFGMSTLLSKRQTKQSRGHYKGIRYQLLKGKLK